MSKLAQLKKNRGANFKKLQQRLEESNNQGGQRDERIWKPKMNQEKGKGTAVVRFLPAKEGNPFEEVRSYSFVGPGGNYWDLALQTIGEKDPIQLAAINAFRKAKNDGDERLREQAKKFLPKSQFYANVLVIKDEEHPENEGKVKIFQFGKQIYGFIEKAIKPEFDDVDPMDPFDLWEGADFKIRMVAREIPDAKTGKKVKVPNYENSEFDRPSEFMDGDEDELEKLIDQTYDLSEFVAADKFKSFDEVAAKFKEVMQKPYNWLSTEGVEDHVQEQQQNSRMEEEQDNDDGSDNYREEPEPTTEQDDTPDDDDDPVAKFRRLASKNK